MKRTILTQAMIILAFSLTTISLHGQVTIGSDQAPNKGALLDLTEGANTTKGLGLPRVKLTKIDDITNGDITGVTAANADEHVGLLVYNTNQCLPGGDIGLHVWDGDKWQQIGGNNSAVYEVKDSRDNEIYLARNFGNAGDWLLENVRYEDPSFTVSVNGESATAQSYLYPSGNSSNTYGNPPATWTKQEGLLYTYSAATKGVQDAVVEDQGQGEVKEGPTFYIQGVCPADWHIPSDKEWNELEEEIYNHPEKYSFYSGSSEFTPATWNATSPDWNTFKGGRGSTDSKKGHGYAMRSSCYVDNSGGHWSKENRGYTAKRGGFDALMVGHGSRGGISNYRYTGGFWTSSVWSMSNHAYHRWITYNGGEQLVQRQVWGFSWLFSVRCKKD
ncbi:FISUMP domain-containing protein [Dysgonomonas sp. 25]|uniref:FISUMP domain-containing protein n=1 Tax=Dysgonomonas sp. 25 TaxID=2302933 RepID=UPI0013D4E12E|nr:FISUMP domain-containing protein [Dysgonomonas sp. 25]NDV69782.1 hypothetical protein [Dysgonomonas sp. 25]